MLLLLRGAQVAFLALGALVALVALVPASVLHELSVLVPFISAPSGCKEYATVNSNNYYLLL